MKPLIVIMLFSQLVYGQTKTATNHSARPSLTVGQIANCNKTPNLWPKYHGAILYGWPYYFKDIDIDIANKTHYEHVEYYTNLVTKKKIPVEFRQVRKDNDEYNGLYLQCDKNGRPAQVTYYEGMTTRYTISYNELEKPVEFSVYDSAMLRHGTWVDHDYTECYTARNVVRYQHGKPLFQQIYNCDDEIVEYDTLVDAYWGNFIRPARMATNDIEIAIGWYEERLKKGVADSLQDRQCMFPPLQVLFSDLQPREGQLARLTLTSGNHHLFRKYSLNSAISRTSVSRYLL